MTDQPIPADQREFRCIHCNGNIRIPRNLPATTGPCPHCSGIITSPEPEAVPQPAATVKSAAVSPVEASDRPQQIDKAADTVEISRNSEEKSGKNPVIKLAILLGAIFLLVVLLGAGIVFIANRMASKPQQVQQIPIPPPNDPAIGQDLFIQSGWKKEAYQVLGQFLQATTVDEKIPFVLDGEKKRAAMEAFYGTGAINDQDTPANSFTPYPLSDEDKRRGLFMMVYDQPPQFAIKEFFRPVATLEVQYGLEQADILLSTVAKLDNFAMEPLLVEAFFKQTPNGLKLDWDVFAQTKYRSFRDFFEMPNPGESEIFRVLIAEDVPDQGRAVPGTRTYRVADPTGTLYASRIVTDSTRINVPVDSEVGRALNVINWRGSEYQQPITRTATLEIGWTEEEPYRLEIKRFLCWEFLGLGSNLKENVGTDEAGN